MLLNEYYFTNTTAGHNKDYLIQVDFARKMVTSTWGPIGGTKNTRSVTFRTDAEMEECVHAKRERRMRRGYTEHNVVRAAVIRETLYEGAEEFRMDIDELLAAERISR